MNTDSWGDFQARWTPGLASILLQIVACVAFAQAGSADRFTLAQPIAAAAISFVIVATVCWEWQIFGDPRKLPNFLGHLAFFFAVVFLLASMYAEAPNTTSLLDLVAMGAAFVGKL